MYILKNAVFWDVTLCRSYVSRRFGGTYLFHLPGTKIREWGSSISRWLQTVLYSGYVLMFDNF
jgi:hypothetical protein